MNQLIANSHSSHILFSSKFHYSLTFAILKDQSRKKPRQHPKTQTCFSYRSSKNGYSGSIDFFCILRKQNSNTNKLIMFNFGNLCWAYLFVIVMCVLEVSKCLLISALGQIFYLSDYFVFADCIPLLDDKKNMSLAASMSQHPTFEFGFSSICHFCDFVNV